MPLTRKSTTPAQVTTSENLTDQSVSVGRQTKEKRQKQKTEGNKPDKDERNSAKHVETVARTRRQAAIAEEPGRNQPRGKGEETGESTRSQEMVNKSKATAGKREVESKLESGKGASKGTKRSSENSQENAEKKRKLKSTEKSGKEFVESFSPRRSSRTSIPNSRYRDMEEMPTSKRQKSGHKEKEKRKTKEITSPYTKGIKMNETESESEDIVTEEIPIDTSQAMDAMASSNTEIQIDTTQEVNSVTISESEIAANAAETIDSVMESDNEISVKISQISATVDSSIDTLPDTGQAVHKMDRSEDKEKFETQSKPAQSGHGFDTSNVVFVSVKGQNAEKVRQVEKRNEPEVKSCGTNAVGTVTQDILSMPKATDSTIRIYADAPFVQSKSNTVRPKIVVIDPMDRDQNSNFTMGTMTYKEIANTKKQASSSKGRLLEIDTKSLKRISNVSTGQVVHVPSMKRQRFDKNKEGSGTENVSDGAIESDLLVRSKSFENEKNRTEKVVMEETEIADNSSERNTTSDGLNKQETLHQALVTVVEETDEHTENNNITVISKDLINISSEERQVSNSAQSAEYSGLNQTGTGKTDLSAPASDTSRSGIASMATLHSVLQNKDINKETKYANLAHVATSAFQNSVKIIKIPLKQKVGNTSEQSSPARLDHTEIEKSDSSKETTVISTPEQLTRNCNEVMQESSMDVVEIVQAESYYIDNELCDGENTEGKEEKTTGAEFICINPEVGEACSDEVADKDLFSNSDLSATANADNSEHNENGKNSFQNAFCEIIEYGGRKRPVVPQSIPMQSAFDYIMFGDNLVEIRKPHTLHGRIQPPEKRKDLELGQVELFVIREPNSSEPSTVCTTDSSVSVSTSKDQLEPSESFNTVKVVTPPTQQSLISRPTHFTPHGHIVRPDPNAPPTDVVEISEDILEKEIYNEDLNLEADKGAVPQMITVSASQETNTGQRTNFVSVETDTSTQMIFTAAGNTEVDLGEMVKAASDSQTEKPQTVANIKKGSTIEGRIIVVDKDFFKDNKDITGALEYQVGTMKVKKVGGDENNDKSGITTKMVQISDGVVTEVPAEENADTSFEDVGQSDSDSSQNVAAESTVSPASVDESKIDDGRVVVVQPGKVKPVHAEGQKLITAGTQTPLATQPVYRCEDTADHMKSEIRTIRVSEEDSESGDRLEKQHTEQYIMVHLPEGTEIKRKEVKQPVNYRQYNETEITMLENGQYICVDCQYVTSKRSNWFKHRRKHLGIKPHQCPMCSYKAATSSNLKRHIGIHQDIRNFVCPICALAFRQKIHLERHLKYRHEEKKVKCPLCDYTCANENPDLKIHIKRRHMPLPDGSVLPFTCDECGIMTVSKKDLRQHKKFHKKGPELKLFCEFCSFVTDCDSRLKRHMYIHTKEKPFQCGLCAYRATQKEHVLRHMKSQHDIEVAKRRSLISPLRKNRNSEEAGDSEGEGKGPFDQADYSSTDRIFACNHCTMRFAKLINLYKHLYSQHKSIMPDSSASDFQCVVCEFRTNNKKNLLVHMRKHNMQDQTPPSHVYSCVLCRYINPRRRNLFQHMKKKHGLEITIKEDGTNCFVSTDNSPVVLGNQDGDTNVISLTDLVTSQSLDSDSALQIVTDDTDGTIHITQENSTNTADSISVENVISIEDMTSYIGNSSAQGICVESNPVDTSPNFQVQTQTIFPSSVVEQEAAEAIEGLQVLAQQAGLVESQVIDDTDIAGEVVDNGEIISQQEVMSDSQEVMSDSQELISASQEVRIQQEVMSDPQEVISEPLGEETGDGIELSTEQINQLSTGDYVEINGEVYEVEIASDTPVITK